MKHSPTFPDRPHVLSAVLEGRLTHEIATDLRSGLTRLASLRPHRLVLDLSRVTFLDASVVTILEALERRVRGAGGSLIVLAEGSAKRTLVAMGRAHLVPSDIPETMRANARPLPDAILELRF